MRMGMTIRNLDGKVTNFTIDKTLVEKGDKVKLSFKVTNNSGSKIYTVRTRICYDDASQKSLSTEGANDITIKNGSSANVEVTLDINAWWLERESIRGSNTPVIWIDALSTSYEYIIELAKVYFTDNSLVVVQEKYNPTIALFDVKRVSEKDVEDDESDDVQMTASWNYNADTEMFSTGTTKLRLYYKKSTDAAFTEYIELTSQQISAKAYDAVLSETFPNMNDYDFLLSFGDDFEKFESTDSISRAFANVHLSGASTGGVAFGKFSAATEQNPMFECEYPTYLFGGLANVQAGLSDTFQIGSNTSMDVDIEFATPFAEAPVVVTCMRANGGHGMNAEPVSVQILNAATATGFTARVFNTGTQRNVRFHWIAVGIPAEEVTGN